MKQEKGLVYYEGKIIISGKYLLYPPDDAFLDGLLCFDADKETGYLIPREQQFYGGVEPQLDSRAPWFCFSNKEAVKSFFSPQSLPSPKCNYGTAAVEISNYIVTLWETEAHDTAKLEKVISKKMGSGC